MLPQIDLSDKLWKSQNKNYFRVKFRDDVWTWWWSWNILLQNLKALNLRLQIDLFYDHLCGIRSMGVNDCLEKVMQRTVLSIHKYFFPEPLGIIPIFPCVLFARLCLVLIMNSDLNWVKCGLTFIHLRHLWQPPGWLVFLDLSLLHNHSWEVSPLFPIFFFDSSHISGVAKIFTNVLILKPGLIVSFSHPAWWKHLAGVCYKTIHLWWKKQAVNPSEAYGFRWRSLCPLSSLYPCFSSSRMRSWITFLFVSGFWM